MKKRELAPVVVVGVLAAATAAVASTAAPWSGAKANLDRYRAVPRFVAPGPAFDAKQKVGGKTSTSPTTPPVA